MPRGGRDPGRRLSACRDRGALAHDVAAERAGQRVRRVRVAASGAGQSGRRALTGGRHASYVGRRGRAVKPRPKPNGAQTPANRPPPPPVCCDVGGSGGSHAREDDQHDARRRGGRRAPARPRRPRRPSAGPVPRRPRSAADLPGRALRRMPQRRRAGRGARPRRARSGCAGPRYADRAAPRARPPGRRRDAAARGTSARSGPARRGGGPRRSPAARGHGEAGSGGGSRDAQASEPCRVRAHRARPARARLRAEPRVPRRRSRLRLRQHGGRSHHLAAAAREVRRGGGGHRPSRDQPRRPGPPAGPSLRGGSDADPGRRTSERRGLRDVLQRPGHASRPRAAQGPLTGSGRARTASRPAPSPRAWRSSSTVVPCDAST